MELIKLENNLYYCISTYDEKDIPREAGFKWNKNKKRWETEDILIALQLVKYIKDKNIQKSLKNDCKRKKKAIEKQIKASRALKPSKSFKVNCGQGYDFLPFQKAGIEFALKRDNTLIADEMGLGKTAQAIGVINASKKINKILIICTASLVKNWANEIEKFCSRKLSIGFATTQKIDENTNILITTYDVFSRDNDVNKIIPDIDFDLIILDECHYIKNESKRAYRIIKSFYKVSKKILLTGTPLINRPKDIWQIANFLDSEEFNSFKKFAFRYCDPHNNGYGWNFNGASNLEELGMKLRNSFMIRREKADVLKELPPKIIQLIELPANSQAEKQALKNEQKAKEILDKMNQYKIDLEILKQTHKNTSTKEYKNQVEELKKGISTSLSMGEIARLRHNTARAKLPQSIDFIKNILLEDETQKVIIFAHHKDIIDGLEKGLADFKSVKIDGSIKKENRQDIVNEFQNNQKIRIFIGSIHACSEGITLTKANRVIFCEIDWTPAKMNQAEDRAHRIGQEDTVFIQYLLLEKSYDARMMQMVLEKRENIEQVTK